MLSRELREALDAHRRTGLFWQPTRELRRVQSIPSTEFDAWVGERPDGSLELIRSGLGSAVELLLNEVEVARAVPHRGLLRLLWTCRAGDEALTVGFAWRQSLKLAYPLDLRWLLRSFIALSRAVAALHQAGWLHGDLKPEAVSWSEAPEELLLGDLRMAQRSGPRRFEAFSARFAAPEQVAGGELDLSADVYALGVMLYSLFIRERFPAILLPSGGAATPQQAALSAITSLGALDYGEDEQAAEVFEAVQQVQQVMRGPRRAPAPPGDDAQAVLGAKIQFAMRLERVARRTADIGVAKELLAVIERATAQKPGDRYPDAEAFAAELAKLLALAEELVGGAE